MQGSGRTTLCRIRREQNASWLESHRRSRTVSTLVGYPFEGGLTSAAASLARHQQIQAKIQLEILDLKDEIANLKLELRRDQDPSKMGRIQDQIGVRQFKRPHDQGLELTPH